MVRTAMDRYDALKDRILGDVGLFSKDCLKLSDWMADNPELGYEEHEASRKMVEILDSHGFEMEYPFADMDTSFKAVKGTGKGPVVALMAEYDALPGLGHACGHNISGNMSVLAALALAGLMNEVDGTLWVVGTPAEEASGAKTFMADMGIFDDVSLALMIHCGSNSSYTDYRCLAMDGYDFTFTGKTAHAAAAPWEGLNALNAVQFFMHSVDMLRQHVRPSSRIHGIVRDGGNAPNIVPEKAITRFEFRSPGRNYLNEIMEKIFQCARGVALATGTEVSWEKFESSFDDLLPNGPAEKMTEQVFTSLGIGISPSPGAMGSTDVGNVSYRCPAIQPVLAISDHEMALHTREFEEATRMDKGHKALVKGAQALALASLRVFLDPELRGEMMEEFHKRKDI